jgi:hypothetical protein
MSAIRQRNQQDTATQRGDRSALGEVALRRPASWAPGAAASENFRERGAASRGLQLSRAACL